MYGDGSMRFLIAIQIPLSHFSSVNYFYKPFRNIQIDIGVGTEIIIHNWRILRYQAWHVNRIPLELDTNGEDDDTHEDEVIHENDMDEWGMS